MEFKIGDKVKYDLPYSAFTWYGTVVKVTEKFVDIIEADGLRRRMPKSAVNFD